MTYADAPTDGFTALGDATRRVIFELVAARPQSVGELASGLPVSRPAVSQHLKVLKQAGLVHDQPAGNRRVYYLDPTGVQALRTYLDRFWNQALTAFKATVEQPRSPTKERAHERPGPPRPSSPRPDPAAVHARDR